MNSPLEIMDEIEQDIANDGFGSLVILRSDWRRLRTAIKAQQARIARLHSALSDAAERENDGMNWSGDEIDEVYQILDESYAQSVAEIEARALERVATELGDHGGDGWAGKQEREWREVMAENIREEADRIRAEASES